MISDSVAEGSFIGVTGGSMYAGRQNCLLQVVHTVSTSKVYIYI
jgi:hypothetical protein